MSMLSLYRTLCTSTSISMIQLAKILGTKRGGVFSGEEYNNVGER